MKKYLIIGDADGLIASINPQDANNQRASSLLSFLEEHQATLYFPTSTIAETITTLQRKHASPPLAQQIIDQCKAGNLLLANVDASIIALATTLFDPHGSKHNTFFDAIVAAIAKLHQADAIFSFDEWYGKMGLKTTSDLIEKSKEAA